MDEMDNMDTTPNSANKLSFTSLLCFKQKELLLISAYFRVLCGFMKGVEWWSEAAQPSLLVTRYLSLSDH